MKQLSVDDVMGMEPCSWYPEGRVRELFGRRKTLSLIQILDLNIPAKDRLWVMLREGVVGDEALRRFANVVADRAVQNHALTYEPIRRWAKKWLSGEDRSSARAVAASVLAKGFYGAGCAAAAADWSAMVEALVELEDTVAWETADAAEWAAMWAARAAESGRVERELQIEDMRKILTYDSVSS